MRFRRLLFPALLWASGSLLLMTKVARAEEYKYPKTDPVLSVTLPEDWDVVEQTGPAVLLLCTPPDEASYTVSLMTLPVVGNAEDLALTLSKIARTGAQGAGMTEIAVSKCTEETVGKNPRLFTKVTASGKHNDEPSAFTFYAFRLPSTGKTYAVGVAGPQAMIDVHRADFEGIVKTLAPLSLSNLPDKGPTVETGPKP